jgi:thioesterase domain-containing protein/acyl carrier protein
MGSSEMGIIATYVVPPDQPDDQPVPCGRMMPGVEARVVDPDTDEPCDAGTPGRLVVLRECLGLAYWHDPDLTAATFITEPDGRRGFRSSDLVRVRPDGVLEHLGRLDTRVKVRGTMVTPATIERALLGRPDVADAAVVATVDDGRPQLVAYVVPTADETVSAWQLRRALAQEVQQAALPRAIVLVDAIPRTTRDKVDRAGLPPVPPLVRPPYRAGEGHQRDLCEIFAEILAVDPVGLDDDFFDLGGDSLGVIELVTAISERFGIEVPTTLVHDAPTVATLAPRLTRRRDARAPTVVQLRDGSVTPFFCFTGGGAPAISLRALSETLPRPCYGIQPRGLEERALPDHSVVAASRRALREIRTVQPSGPYLIGGYSYGGLVAFETACTLEAEGETVGLLVILDTNLIGRRPPRANRLRARAHVIRHDPRDGVSARPSAVAARAVRFATGSAVAHVRRRVELASAGLIPRSGLAQYDLFLRLNTRMARQYRFRRALRAPALVVRTVDESIGNGGGPADLGWSRQLTGAITVVDEAGGHLGLIRHPAVVRVGAVVSRALDDADALAR